MPKKKFRQALIYITLVMVLAAAAMINSVQFKEGNYQPSDVVGFASKPPNYEVAPPGTLYYDSQSKPLIWSSSDHMLYSISEENGETEWKPLSPSMQKVMTLTILAEKKPATVITVLVKPDSTAQKVTPYTYGTQAGTPKYYRTETGQVVQGITGNSVANQQIDVSGRKVSIDEDGQVSEVWVPTKYNGVYAVSDEPGSGFQKNTDGSLKLVNAEGTVVVVTTAGEVYSKTAYDEAVEFGKNVEKALATEDELLSDDQMQDIEHAPLETTPAELPQLTSTPITQDASTAAAIGEEFLLEQRTTSQASPSVPISSYSLVGTTATGKGVYSYEGVYYVYDGVEKVVPIPAGVTVPVLYQGNYLTYGPGGQVPEEVTNSQSNYQAAKASGFDTLTPKSGQMTYDGGILTAYTDKQGNLQYGFVGVNDYGIDASVGSTPVKVFVVQKEDKSQAVWVDPNTGKLVPIAGDISYKASGNNYLVVTDGNAELYTYTGGTVSKDSGNSFVFQDEYGNPFEYRFEGNTPIVTPVLPNTKVNYKDGSYSFVNNLGNIETTRYHPIVTPQGTFYTDVGGTSEGNLDPTHIYDESGKTLTSRVINVNGRNYAYDSTGKVTPLEDKTNYVNNPSTGKTQQVFWKYNGDGTYTAINEDGQPIGEQLNSVSTALNNVQIKEDKSIDPSDPALLDALTQLGYFTHKEGKSKGAVEAFQIKWITKNCGVDGLGCTKDTCIGSFSNGVCTTDGKVGIKTKDALSKALLEQAFALPASPEAQEKYVEAEGVYTKPDAQGYFYIDIEGNEKEIPSDVYTQVLQDMRSDIPPAEGNAKGKLSSQQVAQLYDLISKEHPGKINVDDMQCGADYCYVDNKGWFTGDIVYEFEPNADYPTITVYEGVDGNDFEDEAGSGYDGKVIYTMDQTGKLVRVSHAESGMKVSLDYLPDTNPSDDKQTEASILYVYPEKGEGTAPSSLEYFHTDQAWHTTYTTPDPLDPTNPKKVLKHTVVIDGKGNINIDGAACDQSSLCDDVTDQYTDAVDYIKKNPTPEKVSAFAKLFGEKPLPMKIALAPVEPNIQAIQGEQGVPPSPTYTVPKAMYKDDKTIKLAGTDGTFTFNKVGDEDRYCSDNKNLACINGKGERINLDGTTTQVYAFEQPSSDFKLANGGNMKSYAYDNNAKTYTFTTKEGKEYTYQVQATTNGDVLCYTGQDGNCFNYLGQQVDRTTGAPVDGGTDSTIIGKVVTFEKQEKKQEPKPEEQSPGEEKKEEAKPAEEKKAEEKKAEEKKAEEPKPYTPPANVVGLDADGEVLACAGNEACGDKPASFAFTHDSIFKGVEGSVYVEETEKDGKKETKLCTPSSGNPNCKKVTCDNLKAQGCKQSSKDGANCIDFLGKSSCVNDAAEVTEQMIKECQKTDFKDPKCAGAKKLMNDVYDRLDGEFRSRIEGIMGPLLDKWTGNMFSEMEYAIYSNVCHMKYYDAGPKEVPVTLGMSATVDHSFQYDFGDQLKPGEVIVRLGGEKEEVDEGMYRYSFSLQTIGPVHGVVFLYNNCNKKSSFSPAGTEGWKEEFAVNTPLGVHRMHYAGDALTFVCENSYECRFDHACLKILDNDKYKQPICTKLAGVDFILDKDSGEMDCGIVESDGYSS